jgi:hypothetical protein
MSINHLGSNPARIALAWVLLATMSPARGDENMTGKKEMSMWLCPSAAPGARTEITDLPDGVELLVTGHDEATRAEVRRRAHRQEDIALLPERGSMEHTGLGTGSGRYGHCPGMLEETDVQAVDTPDGVRILVRAKSVTAAVHLQEVTHERLNALKKDHRPLKPARAPTRAGS